MVKPIIFVAVVVIVIAALAVSYNVLNGGNYSAQSGKYMLQPSFVTGASGRYAVVYTNFGQGYLSAGNYSALPGVLYTAFSVLENITVINKGHNYSLSGLPPSVPYSIYAIVEISNTSQFAQSELQSFASAHERASGFLPATQLNISQIGDSPSVGLRLVQVSDNETYFLILFTYRNIFIRVGAYEPPNSYDPSIVVGTSGNLLNSIRSAFSS